MSETIYTIPINETFEECQADKSRGCPFCRLYNKVEASKTDILLGAALMDPDVRIETNEKSFCPTHFDQLMQGKNRLGLGLMIQSHLEALREDLNDGLLSTLIGKVGVAGPKRLNKLDGSCYICSRIDYDFAKMLSNAALLYFEDENFKNKLREQPYICLPHFRMWMESAQKELKKGYPELYKEVSKVVFDYYDTIKEDVSWFCKKFDYRYDDEPWGNAKDAIERARKFLCADLHKSVK